MVLQCIIFGVGAYERLCFIILLLIFESFFLLTLCLHPNEMDALSCMVLNIALAALATQMFFGMIEQ